MGPRSGDRGNGGLDAHTATTSMALQWGRDLVIAEMHDQLLPARAAHVASMGPRSGDRGNVFRDRTARVAGFSFNGAAIW